jgi:hypothetical protein
MPSWLWLRFGWDAGWTPDCSTANPFRGLLSCRLPPLRGKSSYSEHFNKQRFQSHRLLLKRTQHFHIAAFQSFRPRV